MQRIIINNIFSKNEEISSCNEIFTELYSSPVSYIEKIISSGQSTPDNEWLEDGRDEWVILLKGKAGIKFMDSEEFHLREGDYFLIPAFTKHRVTYTSSQPECIWLAVYVKSM